MNEYEWSWTQPNGNHGTAWFQYRSRAINEAIDRLPSDDEFTIVRREKPQLKRQWRYISDWHDGIAPDASNPYRPHGYSPPIEVEQREISL